MTSKMLSALAGFTLALGLAGGALAAPLTLSGAQMDKVTAGSSATIEVIGTNVTATGTFALAAKPNPGATASASVNVTATPNAATNSLTFAAQALTP